MDLRQFATALEPDSLHRRREIIKAFTDLGFNETTTVFVPSIPDPYVHDTLVSTNNWRINFYPRVYYADGLNIVILEVSGQRRVVKTELFALRGEELSEQYIEWAAGADDDA